jgi:hypothetical protein
MPEIKICIVIWFRPMGLNVGKFILNSLVQYITGVSVRKAHILLSTLNLPYYTLLYEN